VKAGRPEGKRRLELKPWTLMYICAVVSVVACFALLYVITVSGDASIEWTVSMSFGIGIALAAGGYWYETGQKRRHAEMSRGGAEALTP